MNVVNGQKTTDKAAMFTWQSADDGKKIFVQEELLIFHASTRFQ